MMSTTSSHNYSLHAVNPWEHDDRLITTLRNSLISAEQMGINTSDESRCAKALAQLPSIRLINLQKEISTKNKAIQKVKLSIVQHTVEKETAAFTHLNIIEQQINLVKELCSDFDAIIKNSDFLTHRLQKPFVGNHLKMDAAFHRYAKEVFSLLVPSLNEVSSHLDNIIWATHSDLSAAKLDALITEVQSVTATVATSFSTLCQMRQGVGRLCEVEDVSGGSTPFQLM